VIAQFDDPVADPSTNYSATINWGDGSVDAATIAGGGGRYAVSGSHAYADEMNTPITVTVTDSDGSTGVGTGTASVQEGDNGTLNGRTLAIGTGSAYSGPVGSFNDTMTSQVASDFTGTIDWGDGTPASPASMAGTAGNFLINGTHTYTTPGTYPISITFGEDSPPGVAGATGLIIDSSATVQTPFSASATALSVFEGTTFSGNVGSFTDNLGGDPSGAYSIIINWGDGTTSAGATSSAGGNTFTVSGSHKYTDETSAPLTTSYTINDSDGTAASASGTAAVSDDDTFKGTGATLMVAPNTTFSGTVATYTDPYWGTYPAALAATIDWGDGTIASGTVSGCCGAFAVSGSHSYSALGTYTTTTTLGELGLATRATATGTANVVTPVTLSATSISGPEGTSIAGTVATFSDNLGAYAAANYAATITWGDGTSGPGTIASAGGTNYTVSGNHVYGDEGSYPMTVSVTDTDGEQASGGATATIADADSFAGSGVSLSLGVNSGFSGTTATFTDGNTAQTPADLSASITWGDGATTIGSIGGGGGGAFSVSGAHTYSAAGSYTIKTTIADDPTGTATGSATSTAIVAAPVTDSFIGHFGISFAAAGDPFGGVVGRFADTNPSAPTAAMMASINWGDGSAASPGSVSRTTSGALRVRGSHTYAHRGVYLVTTTLSLGSASAVSRDLMLVFRDSPHGNRDTHSSTAPSGRPAESHGPLT
jgi:hypothetical protein